MKGNIFVILCIGAAILLVAPPAAAAGSEVRTIWDVLGDLQAQINALTVRIDEISLTPGPQGPPGPRGDTGTCSCPISKEEFDALKARVALLEAQQGSTDPGSPCVVGIGSCLRTGVYVLNEEKTGTVCNAVPGTPTPEICDTIDNNCDGSVDEGSLCSGGGQCLSGQCISPDSCGALLACSDTCGQDGWSCIQACRNGINSASQGLFDTYISCVQLSCSNRPDFEECVVNACPGQRTMCLQDDGNSVNPGDTCIAGTGACQKSGIYVESPAGSGHYACSAVPGTPIPEVCDTADNDCDGSVDEGSGLCGNGLLCVDGQCLDPCAGVTCNHPPAPYCSSDHTLITSSGPGACSTECESASGSCCSYQKQVTDCSLGGKVCFSGACVAAGLDSDGDLIPDMQDNCVSDWNPGQEDSDEDTWGDACDNCPFEPNPDQEMIC